MQVRVFESEDMTSGLQKIREEMGPDALILSTKTVKNSSGRFGVIGRPMLEITAAIDDVAPAFPSSRKVQTPSFDQKVRAEKPAAIPASRGFRQVVDERVDNLLHPQKNTDTAGQPRMPSLKTQAFQKSIPSEESIEGQKNKELQDEVRELRTLINGLSVQLQTVITQKEKNSSSRPKQEISTLLHTTTKPAPLQSDPLLRLLLDRGIQPDTARTITRFLKENYNEEELLVEQDVEQKLIETIENLIEVAAPQFDDKKSQQRIAFVGPTGVGKTTTLAKVCAHYLATQSKSVALITIDTYRIAAVEQLKIYGDIMGLPVDVVFTPAQLEEALEKHQDKELILIDTAGRSPRDRCNIDELATFLRPELEIDKHLVLSAATREKELVNVIEQFQKLGLHRTVFTKLDECFTLGVLLNVQLHNQAPLSWLTNGQRVPEDLLHISPKKVAEIIMVDGKASE